MLSVEHRLHRPADFVAVVRQGRRASRGVLVVHVLAASSATGPARAGLVVSRAVGPSVVRHRVSRRLRHVIRGRVGAWPAGMRVVVRAAKGCSTASSRTLAADLDAALAAAQRPRPTTGRPVGPPSPSPSTSGTSTTGTSTTGAGTPS